MALDFNCAEAVLCGGKEAGSSICLCWILNFPGLDIEAAETEVGPAVVRCELKLTDLGLWAVRVRPSFGFKSMILVGA